MRCIIRASRPGAAILLAALILVASSTLAITGLIISGTAQDLSQRTETRVMNSRVIFRELVAAIQDELDSQYEEVIASGTPTLDSATQLESMQGQQRWIARVVQAPGASPFSSESGKLNLNTSPEEVLLALESMKPETVAAILRARPFKSVREAVAASKESIDASWISHVTVYSADPERSAGLFLKPGQTRLEQPQEGESSALLQRFIEETGFDPFPTEAPFTDSISALYSLCVSSQLPIGPTGQVLDLLSFHPAPSIGLLDINNASEVCLAALPGVSKQAAQEISDTRRRLSVEQLAPLNWPVSEMILTPQQLAEIIHLVATRTLQWTITIESGLAKNDTDDASTVELEYPLQYTLIIDTSNPKSRVIMIRDETNAAAAVPPPLVPHDIAPSLNTLSQRASRSNRLPRKTRISTSLESSPTETDTAPPQQIRRDRRGGDS